MNGIAVIFPGQGSQYVGMGKDLYESVPLAREIFQKADDLLKVNLSKICFEGPEEELKQTKNTQPAIFLHSYILTQLLKNFSAAYTAGHSLGEYTALVFAGALNFEDALKLVRLRGELMQKAGEEEKGSLAAIVGLDATILEEICLKASEKGIVQCANFNSPGQIVISGSITGLQLAMQMAKEAGAKMVKELPVSGAFHSPLMASAKEGLSKAIDNTHFSNAKIPVYTNVTGNPIKNPAEIKNTLKEQLTSAVQWEKSIRNMISDGAKEFIEVGPGKVLQGLVKRINPDVKVIGIEKITDLSLFN
ncbi:MAG: Malonyl CoA-acyl carrier protein transacylase [Ignavibacteriae bacterium]|nr:MAG: Malonyl CoA-acyl carrier protein transacylase [Ignavibacteriota bacterium]